MKHSFEKRFDYGYGIIGDGNVANNFANYLSLLNIPYLQWSRKISSILNQSLEDYFTDCDVVLILIKDQAIENFIRENSFLKEKKLIHFSGSLTTDLAVGMHPLMTFTDKLYDINAYREIPFVVEKGRYCFKEIFPALDNKFVEINIEDKNLYHAMCVVGCNFTNILINQFLSELTYLGIDRKLAFPILKKSLSNIIEQGELSLTGPIERGDIETINRNVLALKNHPLKKIYSSFIDTFLPNSKKDTI